MLILIILNFHQYYSTNEIFMFSQEDISLAFDKLEPHWNEIQAEYKKREEYFQSLISNDYSEIAQVLKCHLIIEHYLDIFLEKELGLDNLNEAKLSFFNKMKLLPDNQAVTFVKAGIIRINTLRNKVAHQLDVKFTNKDLGEITSILKMARINVDDLSFIENIEKFTSVACTWLTPRNDKIQSYIAESTSHMKFNE